MASLTISNLPGVLDEIHRIGYVEVMKKVASNGQARNTWLLENCDSFQVEHVPDPFATSKDIEHCELLVLHGIIDDKDETKIIEFRLRFGT